MPQQNVTRFPCIPRWRGPKALDSLGHEMSFMLCSRRFVVVIAVSMSAWNVLMSSRITSKRYCRCRRYRGEISWRTFAWIEGCRDRMKLLQVTQTHSGLSFYKHHGCHLTTMLRELGYRVLFITQGGELWPCVG